MKTERSGEWGSRRQIHVLALMAITALGLYLCSLMVLPFVRADLGAGAGRRVHAGQRESITLSTTQLRDGSLLYIIGVAPQSEAKAYENAFRRVRQSLQIADQ